jgi:hypothetical protein
MRLITFSPWKHCHHYQSSVGIYKYQNHHLLFINIFIYICVSDLGLLWIKLDANVERQDGSFPREVIMILIIKFCLHVASNLDMQANKWHGCNMPCILKPWH